MRETGSDTRLDNRRILRYNALHRINEAIYAGVAELADARDLKSREW